MVQVKKAHRGNQRTYSLRVQYITKWNLGSFKVCTQTLSVIFNLQGKFFSLSSFCLYSSEVSLPVWNSLQVSPNQFLQIHCPKHHPVLELILHFHQTFEKILSLLVDCGKSCRVLVNHDWVDTGVFSNTTKVVWDGNELPHLSVVLGPDFFQWGPKL